jgi:hypothetical protein
MNIHGYGGYVDAFIVAAGKWETCPPKHLSQELNLCPTVLTCFPAILGNQYPVVVEW